MRPVAEALIARIENGEAMLCHVWILRRRDGETLGFTDHDRDLPVEGVTCRAASGWTAGAVEQALGFAPGSAAGAGGLDSEAITEADIEAGKYDGATVECRRVDWTRLDLWVLLWRASVTRIRREGAGFLAELEGPLAQLDRMAGRTFGRLCDANLGDAGCRVATDHPALGQGCDKRAATCRERFGNFVRFRGFPTIPGDDFILAHPADGERHDGGTRCGAGVAR
ncbi:baseplate hub domain-containing protein [Caulobacter sp. NIBR2454]|uniref:baseplate hub domain-containing protein n=1 Tax=Caulobacter sp. NIBR2454 TaxID=3015996 RepID=UPI0022B613A6|nr:DUF2163 domain-containing protein [Caulobacter sp. NIBR2454]